MLGTSPIEWILIRLCIILFRYTPLLYTAALVALLLTHGSLAWQIISTKIVCGVLAGECIFYTILWRPFQSRLNQLARHPEPLAREARRALFRQCLLSVPSPEAYFRGWFLGAKLEDIRRENLEEFILWAFFEKDDMDLDNDKALREELDEYVADVERLLKRRFEHGRGPAKSLRLTFDSIETTYRGLAWYAIIFLLDQVTHLALSWYGFEYHASSSKASGQTFPPRPQQYLTKHRSQAINLSYWHLPHRADAGTLPIVFLHGIGVGLWTYVRFLCNVHAARSRGDSDEIGIIAVEILPISFRLTAPPLDRTGFLQQMTKIVDHHGWDKFAVVSHSYGSVLTTHMLRSPAMQSRVATVVLIDPVTILLHLPDVAFNFTRRRPKRANEWQLWYFASTDPGVAHCLGRHFFWRENITWREELLASPKDGVIQGIPRRAAVCLSGRDLIVDTAMVAQYLAFDGQHADSARDSNDKIKVILFPELDHAQMFDDPPSCARVVSLIRSYCVTPSVASIATDARQK